MHNRCVNNKGKHFCLYCTRYSLCASGRYYWPEARWLLMNQRWKHKWLFNHQKMHLKCSSSRYTASKTNLKSTRYTLKSLPIHTRAQIIGIIQLQYVVWFTSATKPIITALKPMNRGTNKPNGSEQLDKN